MDAVATSADHALIEALAFGVVLLSAVPAPKGGKTGFALAAANRAALDALGVAGKPAAGRPLAEAMPALAAPEALAALRRAHGLRKSVRFAIDLVELDARPHDDGLAVTVRRSPAPADAPLRDRLELAVAVNGIGIWELLPQQDRLIWNAPLFALFGIDPAEFGGRMADFFDRLHPDDRAPLRQLFDGAASRDGDFDYLFRLCRPDGAERHVLGRARVVERDGEGRPLRILGINQDVTEHREARRRAEAAESRLMVAVEALPDGFALYDAEDRLVLCNSRYREFYARSTPAFVTGTTFEEILRYGIAQGQYPEAEGREDAYVAERLAARASGSRAIEQRLPENRWLRVVDVRTPQGDTVGFRVDITHLKRQQQQLEALAARESATSHEMETFLSIAQDMLTVTDDAGTILRANAAWGTVLGIDPATLIGRPIGYELHPDDRARGTEVARELRRRGRMGPVLFRCRDGEGAWRWLEWRGVRSADGLTYNAARDVTEREAELRRRMLKSAEEEVLSAILSAALAADTEAGFLEAALDALLDDRPWSAAVTGASVYLGCDAEDRQLTLVVSRGASVDAAESFACIVAGRCHCSDARPRIVRRECMVKGTDAAEALCLPIRLADRLAGALLIAGANAAQEAGLDDAFLLRIAEALALGLANRCAAHTAGQERANALAALAELSSYQSAILRHMIVFETDQRGIITRVNRHYEALTGYSAAELIGKNPRVLNSGYHPREHFAQMWRTIRAGESWKGENCNRAADGSIFWVQATIIPVPGQDGRIARFVAILFDITDRKRLADELLANGTHLARVAEVAGIGGWERDFARGIVRWDRKVREIHDVPDDYDIPGQIVLDVFPPETRQIVAEATRACVGEGKAYDLEVPFVTMKGRRRWVRTVGDPKIENGRVVGIIGALQDITERKQREIETERLRARFEAIFDNTDSLIYMKDRQGRFISANPTFCQKVDREDVTGLTIFDLVDPVSAAELDARDRAVFETGAPLTGEEPVLSRDGLRHHFVSSKFLIDDPMLGDKVMVGISTEVTELKRSGAENARLRARLDALMANARAIIFFKRRDGTFIAGNRALLDLLGLSEASALEGRRSSDFSPPDIAERLIAADRHVFETGEPVQVEETLVRDGEDRHYLTSKFLIPDASEGDVVLCGIATDITEQKRLQASLEASRREAEAASRAKSQFLATMSHEIRTPMNGVIGMAELLDRAVTDPEHRRMVSVIRESGEVLMSVINDILDFSKIEVGRIDLERAPLSLPELVRKVESVHALKATEKGLALRMRIDPALQAPRLGDAHRLQQVLHNLVSNAVKFTEAGSVDVTLYTGEGEMVAIDVEDTGVGMTEAQLGRVFEDFTQADSSTTRRYGGTGLGLPIVKGLVEAMGGRVAVRSQPDAGSCFTVTVPLPPVATEKPEAEPVASPAPSTQGLRVLAADDNEINRMVLGAFLGALGVEVTMVEGGAEAVAARETAPFDAVMLDIAMPGMDGVTALAAIRAREAALGLSPVPAIAVTANAMQHQIEEYCASGFEMHVAKPLRREALAACLANVAALRDARSAG